LVPVLEAVPVAATSVDRSGLQGLRGARLRSTVWRRGLIILGLSGLAVAQPLLDLFGKNPQFFVAGNYSKVQIVAFALLIVLVPPVIGIAATAIASFVDRRAGTVVYGAVVTLLAAIFALALLRNLDVDRAAYVFTAAVAFALLAAFLVLRTRGGQLLTTYLSVANVLFLGAFLFASPTAELVTGSNSVGDLGTVAVPDVEGQVVVVVLDEFPATTIMRGDGTINSERYPGFAQLAATSTWFRNASSHFALTHFAVPSILTGTNGEGDALPTVNDYPRNLFTLLGEELPVQRYEIVTDLCPSSVCNPPPRRSLMDAIDDASVVYGHRVLPAELRAELPAIDKSWGAYGVEEENVNDPGADLVNQEQAAEGADDKTPIERAYAKWLAMNPDERSALGQAGVLQDFTRRITASPGLTFVHVALPHAPWTLSRTGQRMAYYPEEVEPTDPAFPHYARLQYQMHSMQVGATDTAIGELVDHLQSLPTWEETLLVVMSDHGLSLTPPDMGRNMTDANREEVLRMPLFIKAPGQTEGEVRDDSAQTIDVLPSIVDLLDIRTDWEFDGHSLFDGSEAHTTPPVSADIAPALAIAAQRSEQFPHGDGWTGLAAVGDNGDLVGRSVAEFGQGEPSAYRAQLSQADLFGELPTDDGRAPFVVSGRAWGAAGSAAPPELLVAVNGQLAGVVGGYRPDRSQWKFTGFVGDVYRDGANEVALYEVTRSGADVTLRPVGS
jgi:hypothetical protein